MKVRITKASNGAFWYHYAIGGVFEVEYCPYSETDWKLSGAVNGLILKSDCEIIEEEKLETKKCPLSKTEDGSCVYYDKGTIARPMCVINPIGYFPDNFEICPFNKKQKPVKSEFDERCERAAEIYSKKRGYTQTMPDIVIDITYAIKEAWFK